MIRFHGKPCRTGCMKAREFLGRKTLAVEARTLMKQPLTADELRALAKKAGGAEQLIAPKRRAEAEGLSGEELIAWLAEDGARVRRPIIEAGGEVRLGFAGGAQGELQALPCHPPEGGFLNGR